MNRRATTLLTTLGLALGGLVVAAPPAAAYTGTLSPVDTSTPGHVRGTVTTDAPYVVVRVLSTDYWQTVDTDQGTASGTFEFDLETWGLDTGRIQVETCTAEGVGCTGVADEPTFEASDVIPDVTWPETSPFTGDDFTIAVTDSGGGYLWAWAAGGGDGVVVPGDGTPTVLPAPNDGSQYVYINRCSGLAYSCNGLVERPVTIDRPISADAFLLDPWSTTPAVVNTDETPGVTAAVELHGTGVNPPAAERLTIDHSIINSSGNQVGESTTQRHDLPLDDQTLQPYVALDHLKSGQYTLRITTAWGTEATQRATEDFPLEITNPAPVISALNLSSTSVYPAPDGYRDSTILTLVPARPVASDSAQILIHNSTGTLIRRLTPTTSSNWYGYRATWNGRADSGAVVPAGLYKVRGYLTDQSGTRSLEELATVTVVRQHLANRTWTRTVTPGASYVQQFVGRCSTIRRPSLRGWSGSFGLYSNTKCSSGWNPSWAESQHAITVAKPSNLRRYLDVRVSPYGGAAKSRPKSTLGVMYASTAGEWRARSVHGPALGIHYGVTGSASAFIHERSTTRPYVYWTNYAFEGRRYDVKSFTVRVRYEALVND